MPDVHDPQGLRAHQLLHVLVEEENGVLEPEGYGAAEPEREGARAGDDADGVAYEGGARHVLDRVSKVGP